MDVLRERWPWRNSREGLVKLPRAIRTAITSGKFKKDGDTFRQLLDRYPFWQSLVAATPDLTPYCLRHGWAWRAQKGYATPLWVRGAAALLGHTPNTHHRHYGRWTDEQGQLDTAAKITRTTALDVAVRNKYRLANAWYGNGVYVSENVIAPSVPLTRDPVENLLSDQQSLNCSRWNHLNDRGSNDLGRNCSYGQSARQRVNAPSDYSVHQKKRLHIAGSTWSRFRDLLRAIRRQTTKQPFAEPQDWESFLPPAGATYCNWGNILRCNAAGSQRDAYRASSGAARQVVAWVCRHCLKFKLAIFLISTLAPWSQIHTSCLTLKGAQTSSSLLWQRGSSSLFFYFNSSSASWMR